MSNTIISLYFFGALNHVLHTLTNGTIPSQELIFTIKKLYDSKIKVDHSVLLILELKKLYAHLCSHVYAECGDTYSYNTISIKRGGSFLRPNSYLFISD